MSVIAAIITKYAALSMSVTKPNLWFDGIPQTDGAGVQATLPWVNLVDQGTNVRQTGQSGYTENYNATELTTIRFEVYATTLGTVDGILNGIKYGTGASTAQLGFDFGTLTITGQTLMECVRVEEKRSRAPQLQESGLPVYEGALTYEIQASVT